MEMTTTLVDLLRRIPSEGAQRDLALQRLIDLYAAAEAAAALHSAAARARGTTGLLADVFSATSAAWDGGSNRLSSEALDGAALDRLRQTLASPAFLAIVPGWIAELREIAARRPGTGACTTASAMQLWSWTVHHFREASPPHSAALAELADTFCALIATRSLILEAASGTPDAGTSGTTAFLTDLCHVQAARTAGAAATVCAELVYGYRRHLGWDAEGCSACYRAEDLDELEGVIPGITSSARAHGDVIETDGSHPAKAGPCVRFDGVATFTRLRAKLDGCLTGARLAKERAAAALPDVLSVGRTH